MCAGLRLDDAGTEALSWLDLWAFCYHSPPDSALFEALNPDHLSYADVALRSIEFSARVATWQKTEDGQKGRNRPEPWPVPGATKPEPEQDPMSLEQANDFLGWSETKREE